MTKEEEQAELQRLKGKLKVLGMDVNKATAGDQVRFGKGKLKGDCYIFIDNPPIPHAIGLVQGLDRVTFIVDALEQDDRRAAKDSRRAQVEYMSECETED